MSTLVMRECFPITEAECYLRSINHEQRVHEGYDFYPQILLPGAVAILPANIGTNFIGKCLSPDLAQLGMVRIGRHPYLLPPNNPASPVSTS